MTAPARDLPAILAERMALVAETAALNARQLRNSQLVGGAEIEILACRRALADAEERERLLRAEIARDETEHARLEAHLANLDRELAEP
jgi:septal ring factor EnvC (AmiA/AmiB activator)